MVNNDIAIKNAQGINSSERFFNIDIFGFYQTNTVLHIKDMLYSVSRQKTEYDLIVLD